MTIVIAVLAALLIGVYLLVSRQKIPFARIKKEVPLLLLSGAAMGVNWILLFEAYRYTSDYLCYHVSHLCGRCHSSGYCKMVRPMVKRTSRFFKS